MGENPLRCLECQDKFGGLVSDLRCSVCAALFRLRSLLQSDQYPSEGGKIAEVILRDSYFRILECGERAAYEKAAKDSAQGCEAPLGTIDKLPVEHPHTSSRPHQRPSPQ